LSSSTGVAVSTITIHGTGFCSNPTDENWRHAPARQIVIVLSGTLEVVTSDNQKQQWRAGAFLSPMI